MREVFAGLRESSAGLRDLSAGSRESFAGLRDLSTRPGEWPTRVAFFCDSLEPSGVGRVMETLGCHLPGRGYELLLIVADHPGADGVWERLRPLVCDGARLTLREAHEHAARARLTELLRAWKVEVFHNHIGATWEGHFGTRAARAAGVPCVVATEHTPNLVRHPWEVREKRAVCAELDAVLAVSESVRESLVRAELAPPERIWTVENGVNAPRWGGSEDGVRAEFGIPNAAPLALFCGRLAEQKDPLALLDSFARLERKDAHLLVVGGGHLRGICEERARENGLGGRAHFAGERADMSRFYAAADAFVLPSKFEGLPLAALEAMAARLPVVGCDADGIRDCVTHEVTGFLAPVADVAALAHGLSRALGAEGKRWGEAGYASFCREFTGERMAARHDAAYRRAWSDTTLPRLEEDGSPARHLVTAGLSSSSKRVGARKKIIWVFAWLVVGGEETEARLLARHLDASRYELEVVACFRRAGMSEQTHAQLEAAGVLVDRTAYDLPFEDTVKFLADRLARADIVIASQNVPDVLPALERMAALGRRVPPLIEHGGLVEEARGPKGFTSRYIGVCDAIRAEAARHMAGREHDALMLPSMVDLEEFSPLDRGGVRAEFGWEENHFVAGWVGRLDRKKRVEDFLAAAALVHAERGEARFVVVGGPDAFMPEYEDELRKLARELGIESAVTWTGDRPDVARLLAGMDALCFVARGEGMPHIIAEAGAARLPVVATRDNGTLEQIEDEISGLFVPHESPESVAQALLRLMDNPALCARLGAALRAKVEREYAASAVVRQWERVFEEVLGERA